MPTYSGEDFAEKLASDEGLPLPTPPVTQTGLVDPKESDSEGIRFAPGMQYSNWITVPVSLIDEVDHLSNQSYGQAEYPYIRLHLKSPTTDEGRVLTSILQQLRTASGPTPPAPTPGAAPGPTARPAFPAPTPGAAPGPTARLTYPAPTPGAASGPTGWPIYPVPTPAAMPGPTRGCG